MYPVTDMSDLFMVDGYSLSIQNGTGIATYAYNLAEAIKASGNKLAVLYGQAFTPTETQEAKIYSLTQGTTGVNKSRHFAVNAWQMRVKPLLQMIANPSANYHAEQVSLPSDLKPSRNVPNSVSAFNIQNLYRNADFRFSSLRRFSFPSVHPKPRVMHWTYPLPLVLRGTPNIYTLHDLIPLRLPHATLDNKARYRALLTQVAETASHILTVSENSRRDIISLLGVPEEKVTNAYQAVEIPSHLMSLTGQDAAHEITAQYDLTPKGYYIFFGAVEPKKNVHRLIEAFTATGIQKTLVIAGPQAWGDECVALVKKIDRGEYGGRVKRLPYLNRHELLTLIRHATATLFPSLYEGFGLPVLESMLLGTPVLTSNTSSLPEVAGDAAILVDPYDINDIRQGIIALETNQHLRETLAAKGRLQASNFSPEKFATRIRNVHNQLQAPQRAPGARL